MPLEILSHGIIVADKDVSSNSFVARERLRRRKSFKSLVSRRLGILVVVRVISVFLSGISILLGGFRVFGLFVGFGMIEIEIEIGRLGIDTFVEGSVEGNSVGKKRSIGDGGGIRHLPGSIVKSVEIRRRLGSESTVDFTANFDIEVPPLIGPLGGVIVTPYRIVE